MDQDQIETNQRLLAQATALKAVVMALIDTHPNKAAFAAYLPVVTEHLTTNYLNAPLSEVFADEFQRQMEAFQKHAQRS